LAFISVLFAIAFRRGDFGRQPDQRKAASRRVARILRRLIGGCQLKVGELQRQANQTNFK